MSQQHPYHHDGLSSHADGAAWQSGQMAVDHGPSSRPNLVPIPATQPKTSYNAPVFQTFQDRRRARDMARQAASSKLLPTPHPSTVHILHPDPSTLAMKERPSDSPPSRFPTLPNSYAPGQTPTPQAGPSRPLPRPLPSSVIITLPVGLSPTQPALSSLARSDTVSSVKSLDRYGFSSARRPLPRTPVGVNSSKSLDRGIPSGDETVKRELRKQPSVVAEEEEQGFAPVPPLDIVVPTIVSPPETVPLQIPSITVEPGPTIAVNDIRTPAKFSPLPSFNLPDSDSDDSDAGNTSGVEIAALPAIAVSSGHSLPGGMLSNVAIICAGCGQPIIGRIVNAMGRRFHPACFKCNECGSLLEHVSSFEYDGKAYCHLDYHDKFAHHCFYCKTAIVEDRFITLNDDMLGERYYHELHFFCSECGDPFLDPSKSSAPGTERTQQDDVGETNPFVIHKGHPYCERCHIRLHKPKCKACRKPIPEVAVDALGAKWHQECFVCSNCSEPFANSRFFPNDGKPLCIRCWESTL